MFPPLIIHGVKKRMFLVPKEQWYDRAKLFGEELFVDEFRRCNQGRVSHITLAKENVAVDVVIRATKEVGNEKGLYFLPKYSVETYWNNLLEDCGEVIELYHQHGTSEQFHSELKSDMGVEKLPSGTFTTNVLIVTLANFAYNLLRRIGVDMVSIDGGSKKTVPVKRRRIKTVLQNIIYTACKLVKTGGKYILYWGCDSPDWWIIEKLHKQYK